MKRGVLIGAIVLFAAYLALWFVRFRTPAGSSIAEESSSAEASDSVELPSNAAPISSHAHLDPEKSRILRAQLLAVLTRDAAHDPPLPAANEGRSAANNGAPVVRLSDNVKEYSKFIQERIRADLFPMASKCYEELLGRQPDAGGDVSMDFEILGDEKIGGVVNSAELGDAGTLRDDRFETCVRESLMSVYFDPPPSRGRVTVRYPITFLPNAKPETEEMHPRDRGDEK